MRDAKIKRKTTETNIQLSLNLDGCGRYKIKTTIPFMDHMLSLFSKHSLIDLEIKANGDTEVDNHHLVEDLGIVLGEAMKKSLGKKTGITRYGNFLLPMDEALSYIAIDLSGRPYFSFDVKFGNSVDFDYSVIEEFFRAVSSSCGMNLHIKNHTGKNNHHIAESVFKGFAKALQQAIKINKKIKGIPSTKKML
ncbi:MAG: imidazoleglycerol-phosphate dehydratase HisB [Elusimicrobia bacterium CG06_land_8_20_14_3_00_38_11]|nr:MAG: imidazoleglycerol-phosphate dehydratase HisB [Elusimicrobia bacterium CG06_land_8_20_14_3_00_38_11]